MSSRVTRGSARRDLEEIVETCTSIENRRFNPFLLDVLEALRILRLHSTHLGSLEDHLLDMKAITGIARVVGLQSAQLRFQSTSLFIDPGMAKEKLKALSRQQLAEFLLLSWHPIVELEQLTLSTLKEAVEYWGRLLSFFERRTRPELGALAIPGATSYGDLAQAGLMEDKAFTKRLTELWHELKQKAGPASVIEYWEFVTAASFSQTVLRAQLVSFLVTYGYATLEKKEDSILLGPKERPEPPSQGSPISLPIVIPKRVARP